MCSAQDDPSYWDDAPEIKLRPPLLVHHVVLPTIKTRDAQGDPFDPAAPIQPALRRAWMPDGAFVYTTAQLVDVPYPSFALDSETRKGIGGTEARASEDGMDYGRRWAAALRGGRRLFHDPA